ncbi:MAG TPA: delta-60 repeat domain-containing protein [Planctomycetota bacterium]|nr:delta-60 repeat domain-containing protein [Planctomycetota bacterium]
MNSVVQPILHSRLRRGLGIMTGGALLLLVAGPLRAQVAGTLDPGFGTGGQLMIDFDDSTDIANAVALQGDGKLVVAGLSYINNDYSQEDFAISRLLPDGTLDETFGSGGKVKVDFPTLAAVASSVVVQPDGKILVAGGAFPQFTFLGDAKLARFNPDGTLDASFGVGGIVTSIFPGQGSFADALALQPDGKIVIAGTDFINFSSEISSNTDFALARFDADGTPDLDFGIGGKVTTDFNGGNDDVYALLIQPDGKLVAVGDAVTGAFYDFAAARYLPDGTLDGSFGVGGRVRTDFNAGSMDQARSAVLQPDGKIVAAGFTTPVGGFVQPFALVRWTAGGVLDASFSGDGKQTVDFGSFLQTAYALLLQPDGKIIPVGFADTESTDSDFLLARLDTSGTLDPSFGIGGKVRTSFGDLNGGAKGALLQPDGRVVAVGFQATFSHTWAEFAVSRYLGDPSAWADKGGALAGALGPPLLFGTGELGAGDAGSVVLTDAAPLASAALFVATSSVPVPFKGGILQASPFLGPFFAGTDAPGGIALPFTMPAGIPGGTEIWLQWAITDAGAVHGTALSNAILGVTP